MGGNGDEAMTTGRNSAVLIAVLTILLSPWVHTAFGQVSRMDDALFDAAAEGDIEKVTDLVGRGANVNARREIGETPLHVAKSREAAQLLIEKGADVNARDDDFGMTPLFNQSVEVSELLISRGADVNARSKKGTTPLMWAVYWDAIDKARFLIARGADVNRGDEYLKGALHIAANWNKKEFVFLLLAHGADVNARDSSGWTPLHWAAFEGAPETADILVFRGADIGARTTRDRAIFPAGSTPLDVARAAKNMEMVIYLRDAVKKVQKKEE